jgi:hypothetical protein
MNINLQRSEKVKLGWVFVKNGEGIYKPVDATDDTFIISMCGEYGKGNVVLYLTGKILECAFEECWRDKFFYRVEGYMNINIVEHFKND